MEKENNLLKSGINAEMLTLFVFGFDFSIINYSCGVCICSGYEAFHFSLSDYKLFLFVIVYERMLLEIQS